jgi:hypothetical protein
MTKYLKLMAVLLTVPFFAFLFIDRWPVGAQTTAPQTTKVETAGEKFKNIKVLNDMPADQLGRVMNIMAASLGVKCSFCHNTDNYSSDEKRNKQTARNMIKMTFDINKGNFNGRPQVSCNTCHNGHEQPTNAPNLYPEPEPERPAQPPTKPTVDQIVDKYLTALGGTAKLAAIKTRSIKANRIEPGGDVIEPETIWFDNNKYSLSTVYSEATVTEGFDGSGAWKASGGKPIELRADEIEQIKREADLFDPANIKTVYNKMDFRFLDVIDGRQVYLVTASTVSAARERLYFDVQTGLLVRRIASSQTVLGNFNYQVDYKDYKPFNGVKLPTTVEYAVPGVRWTRKIVQVRNNVPVDASNFSAPAR